MVMRCTRCGHYTSDIEANQRLFNTGNCAKCDGPLLPVGESEDTTGGSE
jgi:NAD-dependent SIR2 family protein deacetylase